LRKNSGLSAHLLQIFEDLAVSNSAKYFVTDSRGSYFEWSADLGDFSVLGKSIQLTGGAGDDALYVQAGTSADFTNVGGGTNTLYLTGNLSDYTQTIDQETGVYSLTRHTGLSSGQTESVQFTVSDKNDILYFADGHLTINAESDARLYDGAEFKQLQFDWLVTGGTPATPIINAPTEATNPAKIFVTDPTGLDIPKLPQPGQAMAVTGSGGVDRIYVNAGTSVDATNLGGGDDAIYLMGKLADYRQSIDQETGVYTLTRTIDGKIETVKFTVSDQNDVIYFADGRLVINAETDSRLYDGATFKDLQTAWLTGEGTPLPNTDATAPTVTTFGSTSADGTYGVGAPITLTATLSETVRAGSSLEITLDTGDKVTLSTAQVGSTLSGTYTVGAGDNSADLTVRSFTANVTDVAGNAMSSTTLPLGQNLADTAALVIDTTAPTATLSRGSYNNGTLTLTGTNFDTLGVSTGSDVKAQLDWSKLVWDINGDGSTTANAGFTLNDISSAVLTNTTTLSITFIDTARATLEGLTGFGNGGGADTLEISAGFLKDRAGNAATGDALAAGALTFTDATAPTVTTFGSTSADGTYGVGAPITLTATLSETVRAGSSLEITLDTGDKVTLSTAQVGSTLSGTYTVGAGDNSADLTVRSFTANVTDVAGNAMSSTTLPLGQNLADTAALVIDTTAPTATLSRGSYNNGTLTLTGTNFDTLGVSTGSDVKAQLDWSKLVWDINGDGSTTANAGFTLNDISSAVLTNTTTLSITFIDTARATLEGLTGFGNGGGADTLEISAGFLKDRAGNAATGDALAAGALTFTDATAPTVTTFGSTSADGTYGVGAPITLTATLSETVRAGSSLEITLDTGDKVTLSTAQVGSTLSGTYTVGAGDNSADLTVRSFTANVTDVAGNAMSSTTLPLGQNLADTAALVIDTTAPTATLSRGSYNNGTLTLTGTNFTTLDVSTGSDVKAQLDWSKLVWDINGDGSTTANAGFTLNDISSAVLTNATTLSITFIDTARATLEGLTGFGNDGGADTLEISAGFLKDRAGNAATGDALAAGALTFTDATAPTVTAFGSTSADGTYGVGAPITLTATLSETVRAGSSLEITLDTGDKVTLSTAQVGPTLSGTYTVGAGDNSADLTVRSFTANVTDVAGNAMSSTTLPLGQNLADTATLVIDTLPPFNNGNGTLIQNDNNESADSGDQLVFGFSEAVGNQTQISEFFIHNDIYGMSEARATAAWSGNGKFLTVTLGGSETYDAGTGITLNGVADFFGNLSDLIFAFN
jgi:hypothetical protein